MKIAKLIVKLRDKKIVHKRTVKKKVGQNEEVPVGQQKFTTKNWDCLAKIRTVGEYEYTG